MKRSSIIKIVCGVAAILTALGLGWYFIINSEPMTIGIEKFIITDSSFNNDIVNHTRNFCESRRYSETIMEMVFNVSRHVPYFRDGEKNKRWHGEVMLF